MPRYKPDAEQAALLTKEFASPVAFSFLGRAEVRPSKGCGWERTNHKGEARDGTVPMP